MSERTQNSSQQPNPTRLTTTINGENGTLHSGADLKTDMHDDCEDEDGWLVDECKKQPGISLDHDPDHDKVTVMAVGMRKIMFVEG